MAHARLPGGARRKASQRRVWHAPLGAHRLGHAGSGRRAPGSRGRAASGMFLREADDDQVELLIGSRTYRVRRAEVRSA